MSGRAAILPTNHRGAWVAKCCLGFGLLAGVGCFALIGAATAQSPLPPETTIDETPPLPPLDPERAATQAKFRIPNLDRAIFRGRRDIKGNWIPNTGIVDFAPVASEKENSDEYEAWTEFVQHAKQFTAAELEQHAARDLTRDDLTTAPRFSTYRFDPIRFDGKVLKVRRLPATGSLKQAGTDEVFEAVFLPLDEAPTGIVSVVFTELPEALAAVKQTPTGQWHDANVWATAAGYFFKLRREAGEAAIPLLVGRSVTVLKAEPVAEGDNPAALDKKLRVFQRIENDAPIAKADNWEEVAAWNRVLLHARRFAPEELEKYATEMTFATLFNDGRRDLANGRHDYRGRRDYKLDLVKFEGRLMMLKKLKPSDKLQAAGIDALYEAWIAPKDEPRGNPICVLFTDPLEGVEPSDGLSEWVSFAGYSFKLLHYESRERDKDDPNKYVSKRAPLLLGRAAILRPDPEAASPVSWGAFANTATIAVVVLLGGVLGLSWWFRRGDKQAKQELDAYRARNPFGERTS